MTETLARIHVLLLADDGETGFGHLVALLEAQHYKVRRVTTLAGAMQYLGSVDVQAFIIDPSVQGVGVEGLREVREKFPAVALVALTDERGEYPGSRCAEAGAHDYLPRGEITDHQLRRVLAYAASRVAEAHAVELRETLSRYRALSSATQKTRVTAALLGSGAIAERQPNAFQEIVGRYYSLLEPYVVGHAERVDPARESLEHIIAAIGDASGGPRDLLDVHVAALDRAIANGETPQARSIVYEARLLALEMMGLLVDYYRVGHRRRFMEGGTS
ncbi:MAG: response regulator [Polyangiaceae bacterium]|nr:response regulator [Polyangiaceae bacterium]